MVQASNAKYGLDSREKIGMSSPTIAPRYVKMSGDVVAGTSERNGTKMRSLTYT